MSTPKSVVELAKKAGAKMVDIKFVDTFGTWQHFSCPIRELTEEVFSDGFGFDGSSIRGWKSIEASDMLAMPDPATAFMDPFCAVPTLSLTCTIAETGTKELYTRDPRGIAQRAEKYLNSTGLADSAYMGPEAEFFIFDNVQFDSKSNGTFYSVDSEEAIWNSGREEMPNTGYKIRHKEGYFPVAPRTRSRTSALRCASSWRNSVWPSSVSTTRSLPRARRKLTTASRPWSKPPTP
jgi:glutamine synthetase